MADIQIKKGHDIRITGVPKREILKTPTSKCVAIRPVDFRNIKPKLYVKEGDTVKIGSPLFFDKKNPTVTWASPGCGTISEIKYGPRRVIEQIVVQLDTQEEAVAHTTYAPGEISSLNRIIITESIQQGNLWPFIRQRPFNKIVNPEDTPRDIFISGINTAPLTVDLDLTLSDKQVPFQAGINMLRQLTSGSVHLTIGKNSTCETFTALQNVELHRITGPHPAGNVGIQIHHIRPLKPGDIVWTVQAQHVATLGNFFLTGKFDPTILISVGGPSVENPIHLKTRIGVQLETILKHNVVGKNNRFISGNPLTGTETELDGFLGYYDTTVSVIPEGRERKFLGMLAPGSSKSQYSLSKTFLGAKNRKFPFTTLQNGSIRAIVPIGAWESVLPMNILPNPLYRAILARDIDEMEKLGIIECDEEDFALCTFACPSKINVGTVIRQGLELMEKEG